ncbi:unnamed protein product [Clonostachys rosea]|uniref:C2H2-type domain-containing protein n=1 Tax=Bionectria ochroleuca TaxID=29856 RepID=A0ABY6UPL1_BIOOC|nr:unnamed protein product [Clonostachys rosea]
MSGYACSPNSWLSENLAPSAPDVPMLPYDQEEYLHQQISPPQYHIVSPTPRKYLCVYCPLSFHYQFERLSHIWAQHPDPHYDEKDAIHVSICELCNKEAREYRKNKRKIKYQEKKENEKNGKNGKSAKNAEDEKNQKNQKKPRIEKVQMLKESASGSPFSREDCQKLLWLFEDDSLGRIIATQIGRTCAALHAKKMKIKSALTETRDCDYCTTRGLQTQKNLINVVWKNGTMDNNCAAVMAQTEQCIMLALQGECRAHKLMGDLVRAQQRLVHANIIGEDPNDFIHNLVRAQTDFKTALVGDGEYSLAP